MQTCLLFIETNGDIKGIKNLSVICKNLVSRVKRISLTKEVAIFKDCSFSLLKFYDEIKIAKLVIDM